MSVLSGREIQNIVGYHAFVRDNGYPPGARWIEIDPFDPARCGPNSYDVTLADELLTYAPDGTFGDGRTRTQLLDSREEIPTTSWRITDNGFVLIPGVLYLGSTVERVGCGGLVPWIDGRSSVGRLGIRVHATAGRGDDGFNGRWTLEIDVVHPVRVYPGMRIAQITFMTLVGDRTPYAGRYQGQSGAVASRLWETERGDRGDRS